MNRLYRVQEFAGWAGTTVKALYLYDRLGLLKPRRTEAGYRLYTERDRELLEQIAALKSLGVPLKQVKALLQPTAPTLRDTLRRQRSVLERQQRLIERALRAIDSAERDLEAGKTPDAGLWKRIREAIDMQNDLSVMKKYYSDGAWAQREHHYEQWPSPEMQEVFREIAAGRDADPLGEAAQEIKERLMKAVGQTATGNPDVQAGALEAWKDRAHWPAPLRQKVDEFEVERAIEFMARAMAAHWRKYIASDAWARLEERQRNPTEPWNEWYLRARLALEEDPPGEKARDLVTRLIEL
ncbi:MAG: MerR family transcriptional regulator [Acidobacteriia bacterium]|nr:MerR family transcriptional regulator [Terriglobia bacterium]